MPMLSAINSNKWPIAVLVTLSGVGFFLIRDALPVIMQDELVYSMASRKYPVAESEYGNYLFNWVFSASNACGSGFYACAKALNVGFLLGAGICIFGLASFFVGRVASTAIAVSLVMGPSMINASFFMPESMLIFFVYLSLWLAWRVRETPSIQNYGLLVLSLLAATLVKPHAWALVVAIAIFMGVVSSSNSKLKFLSNAGLLFLLVLGGRLVSGFLIAGPVGLNLIGPGYGFSFENLTASSIESFSASAAGSTISASSDSMALVPAILNQLLRHSVALAFVVGFLPFARIFFDFKVQHMMVGFKNSDASALRFLTLLMIGLFLLMTAIFSVYVTSTGDDHSDRILGRYFEFLLPLIWLSFLAGLEHFSKRKTVVLVLLTMAFYGAASWLLAGLDLRLVDSVALYGLMGGTGWWQPLVLAGLGLALISLKGAATLKAVTPAVAGVLVTALVWPFFIQLAKVPGQIEAAAKHISSLEAQGLSDVKVLAGPSKGRLEALKFYLDDESVLIEAVDGNNPELSAKLDNSFGVALLDGAYFVGDFSNVHSGDGYVILNVDESHVEKTGFTAFRGLVDSLDGFSSPSTLGFWLVEDLGSLRLSKQAPTSGVIQMLLSTSPDSGDLVIAVSIGDSEYEIAVPGGGQVSQVELPTESWPAEAQLRIRMVGSVTSGRLSIADLRIVG